jgi:hypothetical protein
MKTIIKNGKYDRVNDLEAVTRIKTGWSFCPKSEWKKNVRDFEKNDKKVKN